MIQKLMESHNVAAPVHGTAESVTDVFDGSDPAAAAQRYLDLDYAILPIKTDGTKAPAAPSWSGDVDGEFSAEDCRGKAVGIKCGRLSDNAYCLDFEDVPTFDLFCSEVANAGLSQLIVSAPLAATPRPGRHLYLHLLERPDVGEGLAWDTDGRLVLESRGQGQYVVAPGSPATTHKSGQPYQWIQEPSEDKNYLAATEFEALISIAKGLDKSGAHERPTREQVKSVGTAHGKGSPGHDYNTRAGHAELLESHGFKMIGVKRDGTEFWQKPNSSDRGYQLTYNSPECPDMLYCFSPTCPPFPVRVPMDKFGIYARLEHEGDFKAAARQLGKEGYGDQKKVEGKKSEGTDGDVCAGEESGSVTGWQKPISLDDRDVPELSPDLLPAPLDSFCRELSEATKTPPGLSVSVCLSAIAASVQKRFCVRPFDDDEDFAEPVSLWTLSVLPPGNGKSPVFDAIVEPILAWEEKQAKDKEREIKKNRIERDAVQRQHDELAKQAGKADIEDHERTKLINKMLDLEMPDEIVAPKIRWTDATPESIVTALSEHGGRMSILSDEGGIFDVLSGLYSSGRSNYDVVLAGHSGGSHRVKRKDREVDLRRISISLGLTVQPEVVRQFDQGTKSAFRGKGLLGRFLFYFPISSLGTRDVNNHSPMSSDTKSKYKERVESLLDIQEHTDGTPRTLALTTVARERWKDFRQEVENALGKGGQLEKIPDWAGKLPGAVLRIAGLMHIVEHPTYVSCTAIQEDTMSSAIKIAQVYKAHALKVLGDGMGMDPSVADAKRIEQWMKTKPMQHNSTGHFFTRSDLYSGDFHNWKSGRIDLALEALLERGMISSAHSEPGKRTKLYYVNPECLNPKTPRGSRDSKSPMGRGLEPLS